MVGDELDCPHCGYPYSEEELELMISKTKSCDSCEKRFSIELKDGYIRLKKRNTPDKQKKNELNEKIEHQYIDNTLLIKAIIIEKKTYTKALRNEFFQRPHLWWVSRARKFVVQNCRMMGIRVSSIERYFKNNNSKIDWRTIKTYENENVE